MQVFTSSDFHELRPDNIRPDEVNISKGSHDGIRKHPFNHNTSLHDFVEHDTALQKLQNSSINITMRFYRHLKVCVDQKEPLLSGPTQVALTVLRA